MTEPQFLELLARGHEIHGVEFKGPGPRTNKALFAKVVRATLGMANRRDGGLVIVGVEDHGSKLIPTGLSEADAATWTHDAVAGALAAYCDPYVEIHTELFSYQSKTFVVISIDEFTEVPVLCKRDYPEDLRTGACYVRRRGRTETSEIPTQAEMRELLDLATEKKLRGFLRQAYRAGLAVASAPSPEELFDRERDDFK
jgi:predicted HTH transcriptional regulator